MTKPISNERGRVRGWLASIAEFIRSFETYPTCPICGEVWYVKTMPLHLSGHKPDDPDVVAWRERGGPVRV